MVEAERRAGGRLGPRGILAEPDDGLDGPPVREDDPLAGGACGRAARVRDLACAGPATRAGGRLHVAQARHERRPQEDRRTEAPGPRPVGIEEARACGRRTPARRRDPGGTRRRSRSPRGSTPGTRPRCAAARGTAGSPARRTRRRGGCRRRSARGGGSSRCMVAHRRRGVELDAPGARVRTIRAQLKSTIKSGGGTGPQMPRQPTGESRQGAKSGQVLLRDRAHPRRDPSSWKGLSVSGPFARSHPGRTGHGHRDDPAATAATTGTSPTVLGLVCRGCGRPEATGLNYVCSACFGPLEVAYDLAAVRATVTPAILATRPAGVWRYRELLPVGVPARSLAVGGTPLVEASRLGDALGVDRLLVKDDTRNPTLSFKDRAVAIATAKALELGLDALACASTGNLAGATAAAAAAAGLPAYVFVPADLEPAKIEHALAYGATVVPSTARTTTSTGCASRSPTSSAGAPSTSTSARTTRRAARPSPTRSPRPSAGDSRT